VAKDRLTARLETLLSPVLIDGLPQSLKDAIDAALAAGGRKAEILRRAKRQAGRRAPLTVAAVEAYLATK
jgi:hypothetical protein